MDGIIDIGLVGELAMLTTASMQIFKSHPKTTGSSVPYVSGLFGIGAALLWFLANGELFVNGDFDWIHFYQGIAVGIVAAVTSIMGYNLQKALPLPNLLPTSTELDQQRMREDVNNTAATEVVTTAAISTDVVKTETTTIIDDEGNLESETTGVKDDAVG